MSVLQLIKGRRNRLLVTSRAALSDWLKEDAPIFGYLLKVLLASLLAMWLSLRFELDQPRTAMLTVAIVMQSRSGMVFAKSYYRLLGTLVGIVVSLILVALFAQERILFLLSMALWIGLCTAGSMVYRNHQSYGFVLAGYTLCIVGLPAAISPELTFNIAVTRISEILIGLICATMVSDLVFPQRIWDAIQTKVRLRFSDFSDLLRTTAQSSTSSTKSSKQVLLRFIGDIYSLESFRASAIMENDGAKHNRLRISEVNNEFMAVATTFHSLEELLRRQRNNGHPEVGAALISMYRQLSEAITLDGKSAANEQEAAIVTKQLTIFQSTFTQHLTVYRMQLPQDMSDRESLDFETGAELLQRLADELHAYAVTYSSVNYNERKSVTEEMVAPPKLEMHFDPVAVALAGVRGTLTLGIMTALWLLTDWRSGIEAITIGVITSTLFATSPSPNQTIKQFMTGAIIGTILAYICNFHLLTQAQGFLMLALAVTPTILFASWLTTKPSIAVVGSGIFIVFLMHIGFNSAYNANPVTFINDAIADLLAVLVSGVMYGLIDISSSAWSRRRIATTLRKLIVTACRSPLMMKRVQLENAAFDLVQRAGSAQRVAQEQDRLVIDWLLSTLEIGHAVIALRELKREINHPYFSELLLTGLEAIAALHETPTEALRMKALKAIENATDNLTSDISTDIAMPETAHQLRRQALSMLHFIHSALLDEESVLATSVLTTKEKS
ncbi:FUSC family protein [Methylotenera versatilis]|uniref:Fusaric acid resistance protein conserved region n=1 Tax=Methylotenera versatilis (strain 301) TaxID=666681 RepID=D7DLD2_METV0|nr:FUSC family protein [Methylotenera versatilis]ADI30603.1 Fusaric acid resistance protein conserved region [Methylotenera versatilis 301]